MSTLFCSSQSVENELQIIIHSRYSRQFIRDFWDLRMVSAQTTMFEGQSVFWALWTSLAYSSYVYKWESKLVGFGKLKNHLFMLTWNCWNVDISSHSEAFLCQSFHICPRGSSFSCMHRWLTAYLTVPHASLLYMEICPSLLDIFNSANSIFLLFCTMQSQIPRIACWIILVGCYLVLW